MQQVDLARVMDIKPITLARHLDKLEAKGRICRENDAQDRRAKRLHLTRKATPMIRSLKQVGKQVGKQVRKLALKNVSEAEFNTFMDLLFRMRANLGGKTY